MLDPQTWKEGQNGTVSITAKTINSYPKGSFVVAAGNLKPEFGDGNVTVMVIRLTDHVFEPVILTTCWRSARLVCYDKCATQTYKPETKACSARGKLKAGTRATHAGSQAAQPSSLGNRLHVCMETC